MHVNPVVNRPALHLIQTYSLSIYEQLQIEEALLRTDERNWCFINHGSPQAIVLGISGNVDNLVDKSLVLEQPLPLIRRFSGGGTVFIDEDTFFVTFICNQSDLEVPCFPHSVFKWSHEFYSLVFKDLNFKMIENDYVLGNKKFGGNAQYMRKNRWLHHTSLLWNYNPEKMRYLQLPPKTPIYRERRPHDEFLCSLSEHVASKEALQQKIMDALTSKFEVQHVEYEALVPLLEREHRKATTLVTL